LEKRYQKRGIDELFARKRKVRVLPFAAIVKKWGGGKKKGYSNGD